MRYYRHVAKLRFSFAFLFTSFPDPAGACLEDGTGGAVLKVLAAVLVGGVFFYNHFRNRINTFVSSLFSRGAKGGRTED